MKIEKQPINKFDVVITLNQEEAFILWQVFGRIGGNVPKIRNVTNVLFNQLEPMFVGLDMRERSLKGPGWDLEKLTEVPNLD